METIRNNYKDKENVINTVKTGGWNSLGRPANGLNEREKKAVHERLMRLKVELDAKRLAIKTIKMALDNIDVSDYIGGGAVSLHGVELMYDPKSPQFGAGTREDSALYIEWAADGSGLCKNDRISYLEEQVAELLERARENHSQSKAQVFQKGSQVALVAGIPGLDRSDKKLQSSRSKLQDEVRSAKSVDLLVEKTKKKKDQWLGRSTNSLDVDSHFYLRSRHHRHHHHD
ncbi:unnamed protein product, partial [Nesidiocoris tenuis]